MRSLGPGRALLAPSNACSSGFCVPSGEHRHAWARLSPEPAGSRWPDAPPPLTSCGSGVHSTRPRTCFAGGQITPKSWGYSSPTAPYFLLCLHGRDSCWGLCFRLGLGMASRWCNDAYTCARPVPCVPGNGSNGILLRGRGVSEEARTGEGKGCVCGCARDTMNNASHHPSGRSALCLSPWGLSSPLHPKGPSSEAEASSARRTRSFH